MNTLQKIPRLTPDGKVRMVKMPRGWQGVTASTQAEVDALVPGLLRTEAMVRFLSAKPPLGPIQFRGRLGTKCEGENPITHETAFYRGINWIIVGGESGPHARPCRTEWVRSIVEQCRAAGVPCFVKQLGSRPNVGPHDAEEGEFPRCWRCGHFDFGPCSDGTLLCNGCNAQWGQRLRDSKGGDMAEFPPDLRVRQFPAVEAR